MNGMKRIVFGWMGLCVALAADCQAVAMGETPVAPVEYDLVIAGGTVEYHGPHCSYGCDTLVAEGLIKKLAEKKEIMIAPSVSSKYSIVARFAAVL